GMARASSHEPGQVRLARDHLRRRRPVRPFLLACNFEQPLPLKSDAADADAVADGAAIGLHDVEKPLGGVDDDRARSLAGAIKDDLTPTLRRQALLGCRGNVAGLVDDRHVGALRNRMRSRQQACSEDELAAAAEPKHYPGVVHWNRENPR